MPPLTLLLLIGLLLATACHRGPVVPFVPLHTRSHDPYQDHMTMAKYYANEATLSHQKAEELANRIVVYERLFGRESDWVTGTHLLAQFYEEAAREQDRQANLHLELAGRRSSGLSARSGTP
ncbi:MAG TPA: hypothetical protein VKK81_07190 [Candidatus Binatia bacterium]|nr:hypothetical protein [Candidatus Binatia bacterium]